MVLLIDIVILDNTSTNHSLKCFQSPNLFKICSFFFGRNQFISVDLSYISHRDVSQYPLQSLFFGIIQVKYEKTRVQTFYKNFGRTALELIPVLGYEKNKENLFVELASDVRGI